MRGVRTVYVRCLVIGAALLGVCVAEATQTPVRFPEPNPPESTKPVMASRGVAPRGLAPMSAPTLEWTLHKTADGAHPSGEEQQMLWLMNRARRTPRYEGAWLSLVRDQNAQAAMSYFGVNHALLQEELAAFAPAAPAAFDVRLYTAASNHCDYMILVDGQTHDGQLQRVGDAGFHYFMVRGSVYAWAESALYAHNGFNTDWGPDAGDGSGMQPGRGHRIGLMGGEYANVGIAAAAQTNLGANTGPLLVTINYATAQTYYTNHFNRFIVGTVWADANTNDLYDPGEGVGGVQVMPDQGTYYAITGDAGGYAIPVEEGDYTLSFSGGSLASNRMMTVSVSSNSVLADLELMPRSIDFSPTPAVSAGSVLTYTLPRQRLGTPYILLTTTNLADNSWVWAGVLPSGYSGTITYTLPLMESNATKRFVTLQGWPY